MTPALESVLTRLPGRMEEERALERRVSKEEFEARIDEYMLAIGEEAGRFLNILVKTAGARIVLEIGTSVGYSTLWLADAVPADGGRVITLDVNPAKHDAANNTQAKTVQLKSVPK